MWNGQAALGDQQSHLGLTGPTAWISLTNVNFAARCSAIGRPHDRDSHHVRGGQGGVAATHLLASAAFEAGVACQAVPNFGAERRGAPVTLPVHIDSVPIRLRAQIRTSDYLIVQDDTLLLDHGITAELNPSAKCWSIPRCPPTKWSRPLTPGRMRAHRGDGGRTSGHSRSEEKTADPALYHRTSRSAFQGRRRSRRQHRCRLLVLQYPPPSPEGSTLARRLSKLRPQAHGSRQMAGGKGAGPCRAAMTLQPAGFRGVGLCDLDVQPRPPTPVGC